MPSAALVRMVRIGLRFTANDAWSDCSPSGRSESFSISESSKVGDLKTPRSPLDNTSHGLSLQTHPEWSCAVEIMWFIHGAIHVMVVTAQWSETSWGTCSRFRPHIKPCNPGRWLCCDMGQSELRWWHLSCSSSTWCRIRPDWRSDLKRLHGRKRESGGCQSEPPRYHWSHHCTARIAGRTIRFLLAESPFFLEVQTFLA